MNIVDKEQAGSPEGGQKWVTRSLRRLQKELLIKDLNTSHQTIRKILLKNDIRAKSNVRRIITNPHPDREVQFQYLYRLWDSFEERGLPIISVDAKKKEWIGPFRNPGQLWRKEGEPVYIYDYSTYAEGHAIPYGVYDVTRNHGHVYVGQSGNTADFAVDCIVDWWETYGQYEYAGCDELLILADGGGSNGYRSRRWKYQLQMELSNRFGIKVTVFHYPRGASKWNPIEHRMFSELSKTWSGTPLTSVDVILECILDTETQTGLQLEAILDEGVYETGLKVTNEQMESINIERADICPLWNYTILPQEV